MKDPGMRSFLLAFAVTFALDKLLSYFFVTPGVILADPITIVAIAATVTAATAVTTGVLNYEASQRAADAQKGLQSAQEQQLRDQQAASASLAASQAVTGQTFGERTPSAFATGLGFGSGNANKSNTGYGRGQLTGE